MDWLEYKPAFLPHLLSKEIDLRCSVDSWACFWMSAFLTLIYLVAVVIVTLVFVGWFSASTRSVPRETVYTPSAHKVFPDTIDEGWEHNNKHYAEGRAE